MQEPLPRARRPQSRVTPCTAASCRSCATSSPSTSGCRTAASPGTRRWSSGQHGPASRRSYAWPRACQQGRRLQHAVHLRHNGLPEGRHADALQRRQQRQVHRRPHGSVHGRPDDDPGADVPLLRHGALHDLLHDARRRRSAPMPYFSAKVSLACINQERITCFNGVPTMFIAMFNHPDYKKTDFSYMRTGIMAGSGCPTGAHAPGCPAGRDAHDRHRAASTARPKPPPAAP